MTATFLLPADQTDAVMAALEGVWTVERESRGRSRRQWFDTFDWRLHGRGFQLWTEIRGAGPGRIYLETAKRLRMWEGEDPAENAPPPLVAVVGIRRLLPLVAVQVEAEGWRLLDERRKTVVQLQVETAVVEGQPGQEAPPPSALLQIDALKGYEREAAAVADTLRELGLESAPGSLLEPALAALGRAPGDYSSKILLPLEPDLPTATALRRVLGHLRQAVERNEEGTRRDLDSEFLHDLRVAVRRARSVLAQVKGPLPAAEVEPLRRELKWLGDRTGPTRDLDVYLLKMEGYKAALPEGVRPDLAPLETFLRRHQRLEQGRLVRTLNSRRYRQLLATWRAVEEGTEEEVSPDVSPDGCRPVRAVAAERIARALRRVLKKGGKIRRDTPAEALHRLRIDCKKLRYLLEIFAGVFPEEAIQPPVKALKKLQDSLGDFNDFEVQQHTLRDFAHGMLAEDLAAEIAKDPEAGADTLLAMGRLQGHLAAEQQQERLRFHRRFDAFAAPEVQDAFAALLKEAAP